MHHRPRLLGYLLLPLLVLPAATGCGGTADARPEQHPAGATDRIEPLDGPSPVPELPAVAESADGLRVTVESADRIVPLSGSLAEVVFTLGLGDRVVARDITATFEEADGLPVVTRGHEVSAESVLSLRPDVVLAEVTTGPEEAVGQIRAAGVPVIQIGAALELDDVTGRIAAVAEVLGVPDAGAALTERTEARISTARDQVPAHGDRPRVAFLYLRGSASVYLMGGAESGAVSLIEAAGGIDAGAESGLVRDFTPLTSEALAAAAPDVILLMAKGLDSVGGIDGMLEIPGIAETPAGLDRRVVSIDDGVLLNYGPRTDQVLSDLAAQLHADGDVQGRSRP
ncbi:ABC transporter substrate-binding protein [Streptomyces sp. ACA25]|uniref:heme/hemin ABC transporter substrate-binding protein n=1 Tax=Streptomyces sp. ACA25 TaxID=3022596 RepID=UPI002307DD53|nr:ABC transporter substrate-binding protein [Streptomyces sp. ACA25]MDB1087827.1 ABC transporter substrate-binding protein [Streptomyces sp. ACA25]